MNRISTLLLITGCITGCSNGASTELGYGMTFAWRDSFDYTNLYLGEGTEPVIPGGCDSAKWNDRYVLTKGEYWRYRARKEALGIQHPPADSMIYFVVDRKQYRGRQELDQGLHGPLTPQEREVWEHQIPGPYQVPE